MNLQQAKLFELLLDKLFQVFFFLILNSDHCIFKITVYSPFYANQCLHISYISDIEEVNDDTESLGD